jgi:uncharacterized protein YhaN
MRFSWIDLERYGRFEAKRLTFDLTRSIHIVHGSNEAGKSTALAAITDLLFRFEHRETRAFRFSMQQLRLGASIIDRDGRELTFRRRRGNASTLVDASEAPLPETLLDAVLSGTSRESFLQAHGLSAESLRSAGRSMLAADGELGQGILAEAAGLSPLIRLRSELSEEASALFKPQGRTGPISDGLRAYDAAAKVQRDARLTAAEWDAASEQVNRLIKNSDALVLERQTLRATTTRLQRAQRILPLLEDISRLEDEILLASVAPDVTAAVASDIRASINRVRRAEERRGEAQSALRVQDALLADQPDVVHILSQSLAIDALRKLMAVAENSREDLPKQRGIADEASAFLAGVARRLGFSDLSDVIALKPSEAILHDAMRLAVQGGEILQNRSKAEDILRQADARLKAAERLRDAMPMVADPQSLRQRLRAFELLGDKLKEHQRLAAKMSAGEEELRVAVLRLVPSVPDPAAWRTLALPQRESVKAFEEEFSSVDADLGQIHAEIASVEGTLRELADERIDDGPGHRELPQALADARALRALSLDQVRSVMRGEAPVDLARADALEASVRQVDRAYDALLLDAERSAGAMEREARKDRAVRRLAQLREIDLERIVSVRQVILQKHAALWKQAGLVSLEPPAMLVFLDNWTSLDQKAATGAEASLALQREEREIAEMMPGLLALARDAGAPVDVSDPPSVILRLIDAALDEASRRWLDRKTAVQSAHEAAEAFDAAHTSWLALDEASRLWAADWAAGATRIGADPFLSPDAARQVCDAWSGVLPAIDRREIALERVAGMERDVRTFEDRTLDLAASLAIATDGRLPPDIANTLIASLDAARQAETLAKERARTRKEAAEALLLAEANLALAEDQRNALSLRFGTDEAGLLAKSEAIDQFIALRLELDRRRGELRAFGEVLDRHDLQNEFADIERASIGDEIASAEARLSGLQDEDRTLAVDLAEARRKLHAMEAQRGAETAAQRQTGIAAELALTARSFAVLEAARLLVSGALERHRAQFQDPILTRAADLFRRMTDGEFSGLRVTTDSDGKAMLQSVRADGEGVGLRGLSEGTADQLFLSLRLAALDAVCETRDPLPFIGDDLLASFDERRAANALQVLASAGERFQVILFTHHAHIVDLARAALADRVDVIAL